MKDAEHNSKRESLNLTPVEPEILIDLENIAQPSIEVELNQILNINNKVKVSFGLINEMPDVVMHT